MKRNSERVNEARLRLVEVGGRAAQDLGFGRMLGQILVYLYLSDGDRSLDEIESDLGLSKAAVSGVTRQLESMALLRRCWHKGDRKVYYRTADNLGEVFRDGLVAILRRKVDSFTSELETTEADLAGLEPNDSDAGQNGDTTFLVKRVRRARILSDRARRMLNSRVLRYLAR